MERHCAPCQPMLFCRQRANRSIHVLHCMYAALLSGWQSHLCPQPLSSSSEAPRGCIINHTQPQKLCMVNDSNPPSMEQSTLNDSLHHQWRSGCPSLQWPMALPHINHASVPLTVRSEVSSPLSVCAPLSAEWSHQTWYISIHRHVQDTNLL
jgi:hypothetical protein